ncbi:MAG: DUF1684 domain-containing protein [Bacteroidetes bacterium]|nr:DUF1684 domain-containing protein [Bacteroidota bacterium]
MKRYFPFQNRERSLAVFLFVTSLLLASCGQPDKKDETKSDAADDDVYTLEVKKDRLEKDKYLLTAPNTPIKASDMELFAGLSYYPVDKSFVFETVLRRLAEPEEVTIATSKDRPRIMLHIGALPFTVEGKEYALQVYAPKDTTDGNYWFIPFTDKTSGEETYGGGRYIDIDDIASDSTFLDFNYAYNPYCSYNERYDCPIPPPENALPIPIPAGERNYPLHHGK